MTDQLQKQLANALWQIADILRGSMNADDFRDYMLCFIFLRYISDDYEAKAQDFLGTSQSLVEWYAENSDEDITFFEEEIKRISYYVIKPKYLWSNIVAIAKTDGVVITQKIEVSHEDKSKLKANLAIRNLSQLENKNLLVIEEDGLPTLLQKCFRHIEEESFAQNFRGLFSEINLSSDKLGKTYTDRNKMLCKIISEIEKGFTGFSLNSDIIGDAYEVLLDKFAGDSGQKAGEFYTPQEISKILSQLVALDSQNPEAGYKKKLGKILDFACGSGSLLLNVCKVITKDDDGNAIRNISEAIGLIYGQEKNITTYNLARMNMLLHGLKPSQFEIFHGDTLTNDWDSFNTMNPTATPKFDAIVANPPFSYKWDRADELEDFRFSNYGLAPRSAADFAFLLHGLHYLKDDGTMAIIMPHGVLFRGGAEGKIRQKLLTDRNIDAVIGLPANLFYSTGIPVCIIVLKKCCPSDDILFINASGIEHFEKMKRQNRLRKKDIDLIIATYRHRKEEPRYSRRVSLNEIQSNDYNLNIARYVDMSVAEEMIDLETTAQQLNELAHKIEVAQFDFNQYLVELELTPFK